MNVSESKFRQILREEARRVLREENIPTGPEASSAPAPSKHWTAVDTALGTLITAAGSDPDLVPAQNIIKNARAGWADCKINTSPKSIAVYNSFSLNKTKGPGVQLAAALLLLSNTKPAGSNPPIGNFTESLGATDADAIIKILNDTGTTLVPNMVMHLRASVTPPTAQTPATVSSPYTILKGESISVIAQKKYTPSVPLSKASMAMYKKIAADNGVDTNTFVIQPGQTLQLPATLTGPTGTVHNLIR